MNLTIERLGHLGDGIAQGPNGPIYARQMLPGELVEGELQGDELTGIRILTPSAVRVKPPCIHARTCGGCMMQHAADDFVTAWKQEIVQGALKAQGISTQFRPVMTSPPNSRRRATLAARRTKSGSLLGFHARGSDTLVAVPGCQLLHPDLIATFPALEALVKVGGSRTVEMQMTVTRSLSGADVMVTGGKPADAAMQMDLARLTEAHGLARLTWNGETVALRTMPMQRFGRALVAPPPGAFLQATAEGEQALLQAVALAIGSARKVVDLFAGVGTFALPLAERAEVLAVEGDAAMMAALDKGVSEVSFNATLNAASATHSRDMAVQNRPWHFGSDGSSPLTRVQRVGYNGKLLGELISETFETELQTLADWMAQQDTRDTLMDPRATDLGFAWFQETNGKIWWAALVGQAAGTFDAQTAFIQ